MMHRRALLLAAGLLSAGMLSAGLAFPAAAADDYPKEPVRLIVPFGTGGGSDIISRIIAQKLQEKLGQPVVVENRPGAGGTVGNDVVARAKPDGYTIGVMTAGQVIAAVMRKQMPYDQLTAFEPIVQVASAGLMIATRPDYPAKDLKELVALAKERPGKISVASPGFGATQHLAAVLFSETAGIDVLHVPFRTSPEAIAQVQSKQVDILFDTVTATLGAVQNGQLKALAVTGAERFPAVPDVPAAIESGVVPGYDVTTWYGYFGPKGMPPAIVAKLNKAFLAVLEEPEVKDRLTKAGVVVKGSSAAEFGTFLASQYNTWKAVREKANLPQQ